MKEEWRVVSGERFLEFWMDESKVFGTVLMYIEFLETLGNGFSCSGLLEVITMMFGFEEKNEGKWVFVVRDFLVLFVTKRIKTDIFQILEILFGSDLIFYKLGQIPNFEEYKFIFVIFRKSG